MFQSLGEDSFGADRLCAALGAAQHLGELQPVDAVLNLGRVDPQTARDLLGLLRPGGVLVNTVPGIEIPDDARHDVRVVGLFVRSDRDVLARLVALVDRGDRHVDVAERLPLSELGAVHARSDQGHLRGKVVLLP